MNNMSLIEVKLIVEDACNPSNQDAVNYVIEILNEAFGKEAMKEHPRCKLILMEAKHKGGTANVGEY